LTFLQKIFAVMVKKILFYSDVVDYGGHEVTAIVAAAGLSEHLDLEVMFLFYEGNRRFMAALMKAQESSPRLEIFGVKEVSGRLETLKSLLSLGRVKAIKRQLAKFKPDLVIVSQGGIGNSACALRAAKRLGVKTLSFLPFAHRLSESDSLVSVRHWVHDKIHSWIYHLPDAFMTTSEPVKQQLIIEHGVKVPVEVAYFGLETALDKELLPDRVLARERLGFQGEDYVVGIIGRISFQQKGQDVAVRAWQDLKAHNKSLGESMKLLIVGDGEDEFRLKQLIEMCGLENSVSQLAWREDLGEVYAAIDMLLIPSRFEGFPLVMLEGMAYGKPVVGSDRDAMAEVLPVEWRFETGNEKALIMTVLLVKGVDNEGHLVRHRQLVQSHFTRQKFIEDFYKGMHV
jgi:glycosyltransferase involved in cell wall biosynthesis